MRPLLSTAVVVVLALAGCASPQQKQTRQMKQLEKEMRAENTRTTEHLRMQAVEDGEVSSERGASILYPDYGRSFDPNATTASARTYGTKNAASKGYDSSHQFRVDAYATKEFYDSKPDHDGNQKYATKDANSKGKFLIPNGSKAFGTKTAASKETWDAHKDSPTKQLAEGHRPYLGKESQKLHQTQNAKDLAKWETGETVTYSDGAIDKVSSLKPLSIEDIRELLNKSK